jgi:hypothetical protein
MFFRIVSKYSQWVPTFQRNMPHPSPGINWRCRYITYSRSKTIAQVLGNGKGVRSWAEETVPFMALNGVTTQRPRSENGNEYNLTGFSPCRWIVRSTGRGSRWRLVILWCRVLVWCRRIWIIWCCSCTCALNVGARLYCGRGSGRISRSGSCHGYRQWSRVCWRKCWSHRRMWICAILVLTDSFRPFVCFIVASFSITWYHVWLNVLAHLYRNSCK